MIKNAIEIFFKQLSNKNKLERFTINAMMKVLLYNDKSIIVLKLYDKYKQNNRLIDDVSRVFALQEIINQRQTNSIKLQTKIMTFYNHFKELKQTQNMFDRIRNKNAVAVNCMLQALINGS